MVTGKPRSVGCCRICRYLVFKIKWMRLDEASWRRPWFVYFCVRYIVSVMHLHSVFFFFFVSNLCEVVWFVSVLFKSAPIEFVYPNQHTEDLDLWALYKRWCFCSKTNATKTWDRIITDRTRHHTRSTSSRPASPMATIPFSVVCILDLSVTLCVGPMASFCTALLHLSNVLCDPLSILWKCELKIFQNNAA